MMSLVAAMPAGSDGRTVSGVEDSIRFLIPGGRGTGPASL